MYNRQTGSSGPGMPPTGNTGNSKPPSADFTYGGYGNYTLISFIFVHFSSQS